MMFLVDKGLEKKVKKIVLPLYSSRNSLEESSGQDHNEYKDYNAHKAYKVYRSCSVIAQFCEYEG